MSAALTLPYVWATTVNQQTAERRRPPQLLGGLVFYRKRTELLLRRYMRVSMDMGRVPSVMGNLEFRGRGVSYRIKNFEDAVIFVIDVERCLKRLDGFSQELIARVALQEYTQAEAAEEMKQSLRTVSRRYTEVLDRLTSIFLESKLLIADFSEPCQEDLR